MEISWFASLGLVARSTSIHLYNKSVLVHERRSNMADVEIPKQCKAGVVVNEGPDFKVEVQMVDVPEPGKTSHAEYRPEFH